MIRPEDVSAFCTKTSDHCRDRLGQNLVLMLAQGYLVIPLRLVR